FAGPLITPDSIENNGPPVKIAGRLLRHLGPEYDAAAAADAALFTGLHGLADPAPVVSRPGQSVPDRQLGTRQNEEEKDHEGCCDQRLQQGDGQDRAEFFPARSEPGGPAFEGQQNHGGGKGKEQQYKVDHKAGAEVEQGGGGEAEHGEREGLEEIPRGFLSGDPDRQEYGEHVRRGFDNVMAAELEEVEEEAGDRNQERGSVLENRTPPVGHDGKEYGRRYSNSRKRLQPGGKRQIAEERGEI